MTASRSLVVTVLVTVVVAAPAVAQSPVGARPIDERRGDQYGWAVDFETAVAAHGMALRKCGSGCSVVLTFRRRAAYAADQDANSTAVNSGSFAALDAHDGEPLWHVPINQAWKTTPMTCLLGERQYVAIASRLGFRAFAAPGNTERDHDTGDLLWSPEGGRRPSTCRNAHCGPSPSPEAASRST